jgi:hypothetical protein
MEHFLNLKTRSNSYSGRYCISIQEKISPKNLMRQSLSVALTMLCNTVASGVASTCPAIAHFQAAV